MGGIIGRNVAQAFRATAPPPFHVKSPVRSEARLAVLWVGHATVLLQLDDKLILTDPILSRTAGGLSKRLVAPGLRAEEMPPLDAVVISHMHYDHLSNDSLRSLDARRKMAALILPPDGLGYAARVRCPRVELDRWNTWEHDGLRITAVPTDHVGWRYGYDRRRPLRSFTGYVLEYHGLRVYFAGDTAWNPRDFQAVRDRFGPIDLALLPIGPIEPRAMMQRTHIDPRQAVDAFELLEASWMVPIHYDTFINSMDAPGAVRAALLAELPRLGERASHVVLLGIGEQRVLLGR